LELKKSPPLFLGYHELLCFTNGSHFPKSEIDFMQIGVSWRFSLKKQSRDQKYVSPLMHLAHLFIFLTSTCALGTLIHLKDLKDRFSYNVF